MLTNFEKGPIQIGTLTSDHWSRQCLEVCTNDGWSFICGMSGGPIDAPEFIATGSVSNRGIRGGKQHPVIEHALR